MRGLALIFCFSASLVCAQGPLPPADPVIHVSVNLVQVDAVVTDSKGNHVSNLQPGDFEILEDGKAQKITNFSWIDLSSPPARTAQILRKEDVRRSIVLLIDDGSLDVQGFDAVKKAARRFVDDQMAPGDLVAITATRGGMGFYQQFTSDRQQLHAALDHLSNRFQDLAIPVTVTPPGWSGLGTLHRDERPMPNPAGFLNWAIQGLQSTPGRKALVLFAHDFPAPPNLVDMANRAGVVIDVIDPEGVDYNNPNIPGNASYRALAKQTGGLWLHAPPDAGINDDLSKVLADMSGYYLLGYQPVRSDFELKHGAPVHHNIIVKILRPELTVRARNGFMGVPDAAPEKEPAHTTDAYLQKALFSPFAAGNIRLRIDSRFTALPPDSKTGLRHALLRTLLLADGRDLQFADAPNGRKKLVYSVLVAVFREDGTAGANSEKTFTLTLTSAQAARMKASGLHAAMNVTVESGRDYQVRAAVRDEGTGDTGSAYSSYLAVPDFNKPQLALSSIELTDAAAKDSGAVWSEFAAGTKIHFECEVFGVQNGRPPRDPKVDMEIRLFRDGNPVFDSKPLAASVKNLSEHFLTGNVQLGSNMEPGDYTMQLVAYDHLAAPKKQVASQWTALTVVKR